MKKYKKIIAGVLAAVAMATTLVACSSDADVASRNISTDADNFKIARRVIAINGITDKYLFTITGYCNITDANGQLEVVCKVKDGYQKHFVRLSDNVTYVVEQIDSAQVSPDHYEIVFKPETIVPHVQIR